MMSSLFLWGGITFFVLVGSACALHALLNKRDPRAALGWIVVCLGFPGVGSFFYFLFGINRIETRAKNWGLKGHWGGQREETQNPAKTALLHQIPNSNVAALFTLSDRVTQFPLLPGCQVRPLRLGDEAYPEMLKAIAQAKKKIYLSTFIFETNDLGHQFIQALEDAHQRGVDVRVLIDGVGNLYSWPTCFRQLRKRKIPVARFLPPSLFRGTLYLNLRNHRKILVADAIGFTGGMNIGDRHVSKNKAHPKYAEDIHFKIEGAVLHHLEEAFLEDWTFTTGEKFIPPQLQGEKMGEAFCRGIMDGPNEDMDILRWILMGAISSAQKNIRIMTPYFIPEADLVAVINAACLRGVEVEIILPRKNNLPYIQWASQAMLWQLLKYDVKIYYQPLPFVHSKFLVVDNFYSLIGSANLDPRSLRLNFEFNMEIFDHETAEYLTGYFKEAKSRSNGITLEDMDRRPLWMKLRDGTARLFAPYL